MYGWYTIFKDLQKLKELCIQREKYVDELEEENKKLRKECEENDYLVEDNARWMKKCEEKTMEIKKLKEEIKEIEKNQEYRYHRAMVAERGGEDEE